MKKFWNEITLAQKIWIVASTIAMILLGIIANDTLINIFIGAIGMFYVAVYSTGKTRWAFILGVIYVSVYTIICLRNRIMLDAVQNIILIPIYIASFIHWGKHNVKPHNGTIRQNVVFVASTIVVGVGLYFLSLALHGNYSVLDAFNTACTLAAMLLGYFGFSINWMMWTANNVASALTFGLALATPTGSITVFAMKCIFMVNGLIGWYNFRKIGKRDKEMIATND